MKKRILSMVMAVTLLVGLCFNIYPQTAYATSDYETATELYLMQPKQTNLLIR